MKIILSLALLITLTSFQSYNLAEIRKVYVTASDSKTNALSFYEVMEKYDKNNETVLAYKGASLAIKAKYMPTIKAKKETFVAGATILENLIKSHPDNLEVRLIRLSIQENAPKILRYKHNIEEDKKQILLLFDKQSNDLKEYLKDFIIQSKSFTEVEKKQISK